MDIGTLPTDLSIVPAFGAVIVIGLLLLLCLVATVVLLGLLGLTISPRGTALGAIGAAVLFISASAVFDTPIGFLAAIAGLFVGIVVGRFVWATSTSGRYTRHPVYRLALVTTGLVGITAGIGLWAYLLTVGDLAMFVDIGGRYPADLVNLAFVTGLPIVLGLFAIRTGFTLHSTDGQPTQSIT